MTTAQIITEIREREAELRTLYKLYVNEEDTSKRIELIDNMLVLATRIKELNGMLKEMAKTYLDEEES